MNSITTPQAVIDPAALRAIKELDPEAGDALVQEVIQAYLVSSRELLTQLREGMQVGDANKVRIAAHTLKSSSANVGGMRLMEMCRALEERARDGDLSPGLAASDQLAHCFAQTCEALAEIVHGMDNV